jgi:hypothetical protein
MASRDLRRKVFRQIAAFLGGKTGNRYHQKVDRVGA